MYTCKNCSKKSNEYFKCSKCNEQACKKCWMQTFCKNLKDKKIDLACMNEYCDHRFDNKTIFYHFTKKFFHEYNQLRSELLFDLEMKNIEFYNEMLELKDKISMYEDERFEIRFRIDELYFRIQNLLKDIPTENPFAYLIVEIFTNIKRPTRIVVKKYIYEMGDLTIFENINDYKELIFCNTYPNIELFNRYKLSTFIKKYIALSDDKINDLIDSRYEMVNLSYNSEPLKNINKELIILNRKFKTLDKQRKSFYFTKSDEKSNKDDIVSGFFEPGVFFKKYSDHLRLYQNEFCTKCKFTDTVQIGSFYWCNNCKLYGNMYTHELLDHKLIPDYEELSIDPYENLSMTIEENKLIEQLNEFFKYFDRSYFNAIKRAARINYLDRITKKIKFDYIYDYLIGNIDKESFKKILLSNYINRASACDFYESCLETMKQIKEIYDANLILKNDPHGFFSNLDKIYIERTNYDNFLSKKYGRKGNQLVCGNGLNGTYFSIGV